MRVQCKQTYLNLQIQNIWLNVNGPGSYNHLHNHAGSILSGVYYVKATPEQGNIFFERGDNAEYFLPPMEKPNYFTSTATTYKSMTDAIYIFPGWLKHSVQPNLTQDDRISISFNYGVKHMRIEEDIKLDYKDVLIRPKRSTLGSRKEVDLERGFTFRNYKPRTMHMTLSRCTYYGK